MLTYEQKKKFYELACSVPNWSALQTLWQSKIIGLTIIAPFLGSLIIFNSNLVDLFEISPAIVNRWLGVNDDKTNDLARSITLSRLQITYFGLVAIGSASFLFRIFCPADIKRYASVSDYIENEKNLINNARRERLVWNIADDYMRNHRVLEDGKQSYLQKVAYPSELEILFYSVSEEITENWIMTLTMKPRHMTQELRWGTLTMIRSIYELAPEAL